MGALRNWLIEKLGGLLREDYDLLADSLNDARAERGRIQVELNLARQGAGRERDLCNQMIDKLSSKLESQQKYLELIHYLADTTFHKASKEEQNTTKEIKPINSRQSWPSLKRRLERNARENRSADEQITRTEQYWRDKGAVPVEIVSDGTLEDLSRG